jgi:hypothetical protein
LDGFAIRFRAKRQLRLDALYEFLDLIVFAVLEALLLVCRLVCHARSFPQAGRISYYVGQSGNQGITKREQSSRAVEMRMELARKIARHAPKPGDYATAILALTLYRRTAPSACNPATYDPCLTVLVQGRKRINLAGQAKYATNPLLC